jgi:catechol 2,3-dioxygenase-like lactoylglutathione lyase family enzyme
MPLAYLDHVNLRTAHIARMIEFYSEVLGLRSGPRPAFPFGGAWLYCGERAVIHLVEVAEQPTPSGELRMEHFAFVARDFDEFVQQLDAAGIEYRSSKLLGSETRQLNLRDPDGNRVHIDFPERLAVATHLAK